MHRFYVAGECIDGAAARLTGGAARQISRVLRLRVGDHVALFCGDGQEHDAEITGFAGKAVDLRIVGVRQPAVELGASLVVALSVLKGEKLDWAVQKLTEVGVSEIRFVQARRTVASPGEERWERRMERYRRIAQEAAEQSRRVRVPELAPPKPLEQALAATPGEGQVLLFHPEGASAWRAALPAAPCPVVLCIGPEGGFDPAEIAAAEAHGARRVTMGARVLRAETAAVVAAGLIADWCEQTQ